MVSNSDYVQRQTDHGIVVLSIIGYFGQLVRGPHIGAGLPLGFQLHEEDSEDSGEEVPKDSDDDSEEDNKRRKLA